METDTFLRAVVPRLLHGITAVDLKLIKSEIQRNNRSVGYQFLNSHSGAGV